MKILNCSGRALTNFSNFTVTLSKETSLCDLDFWVNRTLTTLDLKIVTKMMPRNVKLMSWNMNFCQHLTRNNNSIIQKVYKKIKTFGRMPTECPVQPGKYFMHQMDFNDAMHTTYMPIMDLFIRVEFFTLVGKKQVPFAELSWLLRLMPKLDEKGLPVKNSRG